jgi:hypothetical protein
MAANMNTVEKLSQEIRTLPEDQAKEVLDFVGFLKARRRCPPGGA